VAALLRTPTILQSTRMINYRRSRSFRSWNLSHKTQEGINNSSAGERRRNGGRVGVESRSTSASIAVRHLDLVDVSSLLAYSIPDSLELYRKSINQQELRNRRALSLRIPRKIRVKFPKFRRHTLAPSPFFSSFTRWGTISALVTTALPWTPCAAGDIRIGW